MLDPAGALVWPARRLLAVADLHLEKGSAAAARGALLPPWDSAATLDRLALLVRRHRPAVLVALGDSFHDQGGPARLGATERGRLERLAGLLDLVWIQGNHDPAPTGLPGRSLTELADGPLVFRHQAAAAPRGEISGHFHPRATVPVRGAAVTRACFVADPSRLLLPAFGAYTGGLDVADPAIAGLFPRGGRLFLLGQDRLFSFPLAPRRTRRLPPAQPAIKL